MLACGTTAIGGKRYCCASPDCTHSRFFCQSCRSKACSACGFKATEQWVAQQSHILPDGDWQHITFTMPHLLRHSYTLITRGSLQGRAISTTKNSWVAICSALRAPLEDPLLEEDPRSLAKRQIPRLVPEATAGIGGKAPAL